MELQETNWPARYGSSVLGGVISTQLVVEPWMQMQMQLREEKYLGRYMVYPALQGPVPVAFLGSFGEGLQSLDQQQLQPRPD